MAHIKATATTKGNRDSKPKMLGIKKYGGEKVIPGNIIVRQKGSKFVSGLGTKVGNDFTIYSILEGMVKFSKRLGKNIVSVYGTK